MRKLASAAVALEVITGISAIAYANCPSQPAGRNRNWLSLPCREGESPGDRRNIAHDDVEAQAQSDRG